MTFGFSDTDDEQEAAAPKINYKQSDKLERHSWHDLSVGMKVQSILTGNFGSIVKLSRKWVEVGIDWDNGKKSYDKLACMENVIVIKGT